jgi:hypothetical protein
MYRCLLAGRNKHFGQGINYTPPVKPDLQVGTVKCKSAAGATLRTELALLLNRVGSGGNNILTPRVPVMKRKLGLIKIDLAAQYSRII